jgi:pimeloyl-ACP methyl ester carboxylesterase
MHLFYLHGFASSPASSKAAALAARFAPRGIALHCPDFNQPDFSTLTTTRMIGQVERAMAALPPGPVVLVGSSLGAFVAVLVAERQPAVVSRLVLLAPALDFGGNRMRELGPEGLARWRETDALEIFHYAYGERRIVRYALYEDAGRYDALSARVEQPILIVQGTRDTVVDPGMVERYARGRANVTLRLVDDEHQLAESLPAVLPDIDAFLGFGS